MNFNLPVKNPFYRNEKRVKIRVKVHPNATSLPRAEDIVLQGIGSNNVPQGVQELLVYESDLPRIIAERLETEMHVFEIAKQNHKEKVRAHVLERTKVPLSDDPALWTDAQRKAVNTYSGNPHNEFRNMKLRCLKPLESLEVIEKDIDAPQDEEKQQMMTMVSQLRAGENSQDLAAVLAKMTAILEKLSQPQQQSQAQFVGKPK